MDKELEDILKKANKGDSSVKAETKETPRVFPPSQPYDYLVYSKLTRFSGYYKILFFFILPAALCVGFFFSAYATIITLVAYAGLLAIYAIIDFIRFQTFKGWHEKLPFSLEGWNEMIATKKMFCDLCWNHTRITIELKEGTEEIKQLTEAALKIFSKRTQMAFYTMDIGAHATRSRRDWELKGKTSAEGSANPEVMRYMKDLYEKELATIARKTKAIKKVKIELLSEEFVIAIEKNTGD